MFTVYLLIFVSRILDVSLGIIRTLMTVRGSVLSRRFSALSRS